MADASVTGVKKIDLTDLNAVRLQYGEDKIWKLGDLNNLSYKLSFGLEISRREQGSGTVDLTALAGGKNGYFRSGVPGDFMPSVTPTDPASADGAEE